MRLLFTFTLIVFFLLGYGIGYSMFCVLELTFMSSSIFLVYVVKIKIIRWRTSFSLFLNMFLLIVMILKSLLIDKLFGWSLVVVGLNEIRFLVVGLNEILMTHLKVILSFMLLLIAYQIIWVLLDRFMPNFFVYYSYRSLLKLVLFFDRVWFFVCRPIIH